MIGRLGLPLLGGVLLGVSYFPGPFLALNLAAFFPLLWWFETNPDASAWRRLEAGLVFGLTTELVMLHFMYSMLAWSWLAALLYVGLACALGVRIALAIVIVGWLRRRLGWSWGWLLPLAWLPLEWAQTWGDLRMTGDHVAHALAGYPFLVQFADVAGPYGVGAVVLALNGLLFEAWLCRGARGSRTAAWVAAALVAAVLGYDAWAWNRELPSSGTLRVGIVQPNVPLAVKRSGEEPAEQWRKLEALTREAARQGAKLVVWPETARPVPLYHRLDRPETYAMAEVQELARSTGVALLVGVEYVRIEDDEHYELFNAAMAVDEQGRLLEEWGAKVYLVPFTEAVPFRRVFGPLLEGRGGEWQWLSGGFAPGPATALVDVAGARIGTLVCYEQLFPDLARGLRRAGAELQVVITNDAWWLRSLFQPYLANALRMRAIENRTAFVRVANTGISGFVDAYGRYSSRTPLFEQAVVVEDVPLTSGITPYDRVGDLVAWLAIAGLAAALGLARAAPEAGDRVTRWAGMWPSSRRRA